MAVSKAKILFVEDDPTLAFVVKSKLEQQGYEVTHTVDGDNAWNLFMKNNFDLCMLDVLLPNKGGLWLADQIRKKNDHIPILLLTSKTLDDDKIEGFKSGADDYITKPFNIQELLLRIEVFLRRTKRKNIAEPEVIRLGNYDFDYANLTLTSLSEKKQLTQREADLLFFFATNPNKILKREDILLQVWGKEDYFLGRSMDVFVTKIRKHIKGQPGLELQTLHGIGFKFINEAAVV
ncbi:MAG: response regulator transcription factor [Bacteroidetes bacterium]|nr:response regulator transcription factor [Bacteroidota bacterium]